MSHDDDFYAGFDGFDDEPAKAAPKLVKPKPARSVKEREANLKAFEAANPVVAAWWKNNNHEFACSLRDAAATWGRLTDGQMAAVERARARYEAAKAETRRRADEAPALEMSEAYDVFNRGLDTLRLAFDGKPFKLTVAKAAHQRGYVFVNSNELYLGKIELSTGKLLPSRDCDDAYIEALAAALGDIEGCSVQYGRLTNHCSCCGRELNNPESVALGIGPICRAKYFG